MHARFILRAKEQRPYGLHPEDRPRSSRRQDSRLFRGGTLVRQDLFGFLRPRRTRRGLFTIRGNSPDRHYLIVAIVRRGKVASTRSHCDCQAHASAGRRFVVAARLISLSTLGFPRGNSFARYAARAPWNSRFPRPCRAYLEPDADFVASGF